MIQLFYMIKKFIKGTIKMKTNLKKLTAMISVISMLASSASVFASFSDMPEGEVGVAMQAAVDNGLLNGYDTENGKEIRPNGNITRAEMGTILVRAMGAKKTADISNFVDMNTAQWHYDYMSKAVAMGAFKGDNENKLNPENYITFQEAFIVLSRIFDLSDKMTTEEIKNHKAWKLDTVIDDVKTMAETNPTPLDPFAGYKDSHLVADWAKEDFGNILKFGYWKTDDGYLRPTEYITRAEFAQVMHNLVQTYIDEEDVSAVQYETKENDESVTKTVYQVNTKIDGNAVIRVSDAMLKDVNDINCNIYISDGAVGTVYFEDCVLSRIVARDANIGFYGGYVINVKSITPEHDLYLPAPPINNIIDSKGFHIKPALKEV